MVGTPPTLAPLPSLFPLSCNQAELGTGEGSPGNYGTWDSLVRGLANAADLRKLRKEVRKGQAKVETVGPRLPKKTIFKVCLPLRPRLSASASFFFCGGEGGRAPAVCGG